MRFLPLEKLINLQDGYRRNIKIDQLDVLMLQEAGEVFIVNSRCPHQEHPLIDAEVIDGAILCPRHQFAFSLNNGAHVGGLCAALEIYSPVYEGSHVGILVSE